MAGGVAFSFDAGGRAPERARIHVIKTGGAHGAERFRVVHELPVLALHEGLGFHFLGAGIEFTEHEVRTALGFAGYARGEIEARLGEARARFETGQD